MGIFTSKKNRTNQLMKPIREFVPAKYKGDTVISQTFGVKFKLPEGFVFDQIRSGFKNGNDFAAIKDNVYIGVFYSPMDFADLLPNWTDSKKRLIKAVVDRTYYQPETIQIEYVEFMGYDCYHVKGNRLNKSSVGYLYAEEYTCATPFGNLSFLAFAPENQGHLLEGLFDNFKRV